MNKTSEKYHKIVIIITSIIGAILLVLSFILPLRKSDCLSSCPHNTDPYLACPDVCVYEYYNIWGIKISEGNG